MEITFFGILCIVIISIVYYSFVWFLTKKIVYRLAYIGTMAVEDARRDLVKQNDTNVSS